jgi:hypothetical protein
MALLLLGCATRSVLDCIRTELRTVLAIAFSDRTDKAMQPLASRSQPNHPHSTQRTMTWPTSKTETAQRRRAQDKDPLVDSTGTNPSQ